MRSRRAGVWCGLMAFGMAGTAWGQAAPAPNGTAGDVEALRAELARTRQELADLRSEVRRGDAAPGDPNGTWLNDRRRDEVRSIVREVLADVETRPSTKGSPLLAGRDDKSFFLRSADDKYLLRFGGQIQLRYLYNNRDNPSDPVGVDDDGDGTPDRFIGGDENEFGFQIRRMKLAFEGHAIDPRLEYEVVLAANRDADTVGLETARVSWELAEGLFEDKDSLIISAGRFKGPFLREELTSSKRQLAVERSVVNEAFTVGYTEGAALTWKGRRVRVSAMLDDGQNAGEIGGDGDDFQNDNTDYGLTGRVDVRLAGKEDWKQWDDFSAWSGEPTAVFLGAAVHYQSSETGDNQVEAPANDGFVSWTVDGSLEHRGFNFYGAVIGQHTDGAGGSPSLDNYGAQAQMGYFVIPDKLEPFVRYEYLNIDKAVATDDGHLITVGANYYFAKHAAKFTLDAVWSLEPLTPGNVNGAGLSGLGLLNDAPGQDNQFAVRAQFQLLF